MIRKVNDVSQGVKRPFRFQDVQFVYDGIATSLATGTEETPRIICGFDIDESTNLLSAGVVAFGNELWFHSAQPGFEISLGANVYTQEVASTDDERVFDDNTMQPAYYYQMATTTPGGDLIGEFNEENIANWSSFGGSGVGGEIIELSYLNENTINVTNDIINTIIESNEKHTPLFFVDPDFVGIGFGSITRISASMVIVQVLRGSANREINITRSTGVATIAQRASVLIDENTGVVQNSQNITFTDSLIVQGLLNAVGGVTFGATIISGGTNLNSMTTPGIYRTNSNTAAATIINSPVTYSFSLLVLSGVATTGACTQILIQYLQGTGGVRDNCFWLRNINPEDTTTEPTWRRIKFADESTDIPEGSITQNQLDNDSSYNLSSISNVINLDLFPGSNRAYFSQSGGSGVPQIQGFSGGKEGQIYEIYVINDSAGNTLNLRFAANSFMRCTNGSYTTSIPAYGILKLTIVPFNSTYLVDYAASAVGGVLYSCFYDGLTQTRVYNPRNLDVAVSSPGNGRYLFTNSAFSGNINIQVNSYANDSVPIASVYVMLEGSFEVRTYNTSGSVTIGGGVFVTVTKAI